MFKRIVIDMEAHSVDIDLLTADLALDGLVFVDLNLDGELIIEDNGATELWIARIEGAGVGNTYWGDLPGGYEFCGGK